MLGIFLDIETNGLNPFQHRPLEIAISIIDLANGTKHGEYQSLLTCTYEDWKSCDPNSLTVNGFTWTDFEKAPSIEQVSYDIKNFFTKM